MYAPLDKHQKGELKWVPYSWNASGDIQMKWSGLEPENNDSRILYYCNYITCMYSGIVTIHACIYIYVCVLFYRVTEYTCTCM